MLPILSALILALQGAAPASGPVGVWKTQTDDGLIRIASCGGSLCGFVAGSARLTAQPGQLDERNRDPALRSRQIMGLLMMKLKPVGAGQWRDGWIYNPKDGGTYQASIEMAKDGHLRLRGCIVVPLCKTEVWTRIS